MGRLKLPTLILAVGMLLLPPRWCCALPGSGAACCIACAPKLEATRSCCACSSKECGTRQAVKAAPSKCVCHFGQMRKEPGVPGDVLLGASLALAAVPSLCPQVCAGLAADDPSVPCDVQSRLCRWQI